MAAVLTRWATAEPVDAHFCLSGAEALLRFQKGVVVEPVGLAPPTQTGHTKLKKKSDIYGSIWGVLVLFGVIVDGVDGGGCGGAGGGAC